MTIPWQNLIGAAFALSILGWLLVGATMALIRWCVFGDSKPVKDSFGWLDFWLGTIERVVAATMFVLHVSSLPGFIGAWIAFKLAANWQRIKSESDPARKGTLIALIGSVLSFAFAIGVGYCLNPAALSAFTTK